MVEIWAAVRELDSVLLEFLEDNLMRFPQLSPKDLALLEDVRLALSSLIIVEERLLVLVPELVPESVEGFVAESSLSSLPPHDENSNVMLTKRINQDNKLFIFFLFKNVKEVGLKSHKFKFFNLFDIHTKTKY